MPRAKPVLPFDNIGQLLEQLGGIPPDRIRSDPQPGRATVRDLIYWHERGARLYELIAGTLVEKPMGFPEAVVGSELGRRIGNFVADHGLGLLAGADALIELLPDLVRGPDVCFVSNARLTDGRVSADAVSTIPPDLAVEVLSPRNTRKEMLRKRKEYFLAGVRLVWEIDPATRTATVYTAPDAKTSIPADGSLDGGDVLPGFRLPLAGLFDKLEPPAAKKPPRRRR